MASEDTAPETKGVRKSEGYLFIPKKLQRADILLWLRRMHAWTGFYGAVFFFFLGLTGFYLNHRTSLMHIEGGATEVVATLSVDVDPGAIGSEEDLVAWMRDEIKIKPETYRSRSRPGGPVLFDGRIENRPATYEVSYRGPNAIVTAIYEEGANRVRVNRDNASFLKGVIDLHKVIGVNTLFILIMDTMAGAMMFMSLSGILLWTRLHGPRLAAAGIVGAVTLASLFAISGSWISWAAR